MIQEFQFEKAVGKGEEASLWGWEMLAVAPEVSWAVGQGGLLAQ